MNPKSFTKNIFPALITVLISLSIGFSQTAPAKRNSPFSPNPKKRTENLTAVINPEEPKKNGEAEASAGNNQESAGANAEVKTENSPAEESQDSFESRTITEKILEAAKKAGELNVNPTETYRIGTGDILFIGLQNAPARETNYFTVLQDGNIDYPLAGAPVPVAGLTAEEVEEILRSKIKLYENPAVNVKIREYNSHSYTVLGLVEKSGEKYLQREAVPIFVVRAEAVADAKANRIIIKHKNGETVNLDLKEADAENTLVYSGDIIEFAADEAAPIIIKTGQFYYIGGQVSTGGQKNFAAGITLTQAVLASGGLKKSSVRKVVIRRKNEQGLLISTEFDLKAIKDGKVPDPLLQAGDTIEIGN